MTDGGKDISALWFRGLRYIQMDITTGSQRSLSMDFYSTYTGYPFVPKLHLQVMTNPSGVES
jgi:hypothetical protein